MGLPWQQRLANVKNLEKVMKFQPILYSVTFPQIYLMMMMMAFGGSKGPASPVI